MDNTHKYDMFSQMTLEELIINEKCCLNMMSKTTSEYLNNISKLDLDLIREVMKNVHNYNWISKTIKVKGN